MRAGRELNSGAFLEICGRSEERAMKDWSPRTIWHRLREALESLLGGEAGDDEPELLFHLAFTAPFVLAILMMLRRA
jgi:hypothetical protein